MEELKNAKLTSQQLEDVTGGSYNDAGELFVIMSYNRDEIMPYLVKSGNFVGAMEGYLADKLGIHSNFNTKTGAPAEYWDDSGKKYTQKEIKILLRKKLDLDA